MNSRPPFDPLWRTALRNSSVALVAVGVGGLKYLYRNEQSANATAWWVWLVVAISIVVICFAHAALAVAIGQRRSDIAFKILLGAFAVALVIWLQITLDRGAR